VPGEPLALLEATGADRVSLLHRLLTADIAGIRPGQGKPAALLTPKGMLMSALHVFVAPDAVWIATAAAAAEQTLATLNRYAVMDDFTCVLSPKRALRIVGAGAEAVVSCAVPGFDADADDAAWAHREFGQVLVVQAQELGGLAYWLFAAPDRFEAIEQTLTAQNVEWLTEAEALQRRIEAGEPRYGFEYGGAVSSARFPMEVGLSAAIDYGKGCYLGQEPIVRIRDRGKTNWRLSRVRFSGQTSALKPGLSLSAAQRDKAAILTSVAANPSSAVALALVHADVPDAAEVQVDAALGTAVGLIEALEAKPTA